MDTVNEIQDQIARAYSMAYFFVLFVACGETAESEKSTSSVSKQTIQAVKFKKFDIQAKCVVNKDGFQKMFVQYQNQIQTCFADSSPKTLDIKAKITNGTVESMNPQPSSCLKGIIEQWQFDSKCSSDLVLQIRPVQ